MNEFSVSSLLDFFPPSSSSSQHDPATCSNLHDHALTNTLLVVDSPYVTASAAIVAMQIAAEIIARGDAHLCIVALDGDQPSHYIAQIRKLGVNASSSKHKGLLSFLKCTAFHTQTFHHENNAFFAESINANFPLIDSIQEIALMESDGSTRDPLQGLYFKAVDIAMSVWSRMHKPTLFLIDSVTALQLVHSPASSDLGLVAFEWIQALASIHRNLPRARAIRLAQPFLIAVLHEDDTLQQQQQQYMSNTAPTATPTVPIHASTTAAHLTGQLLSWPPSSFSRITTPLLLNFNLPTPTCIRLRPISTGKFTEVDGQLTVTAQSRSGANTKSSAKPILNNQGHHKSWPTLVTNTVFFKLTENAIKCHKM